MGWLHRGLRPWGQSEEPGCSHELVDVPLLRDAGCLQASGRERRHLAQCADPRSGEGAGVHGQADGNEPVGHGGDAPRRHRLPADFREATAWDLDGQREPSEEGLKQAIGRPCFRTPSIMAQRGLHDDASTNNHCTGPISLVIIPSKAV